MGGRTERCTSGGFQTARAWKPWGFQRKSSLAGELFAHFSGWFQGSEGDGAIQRESEVGTVRKLSREKGEAGNRRNGGWMDSCSYMRIIDPLMAAGPQPGARLVTRTFGADRSRTRGPSRPALARREFGMTARRGGWGVLVNHRTHEG